MIQVTKAPQEGAVVDVMTSSPPEIKSQVEFIKGKRAVALGIVVENTANTYKVVVVASETGGGQ